MASSPKPQPTESRLPEWVELSDEEAREMFDRAARRKLGVSGEEFLRRWDAGEYADDSRHWDAVELSLMIPFMGRPIVLPNDE